MDSGQRTLGGRAQTWHELHDHAWSYVSIASVHEDFHRHLTTTGIASRSSEPLPEYRRCNRSNARRRPYVVDVEGVYVGAAGCHPSGSVIGAAEHNAARRILVDVGAWSESSRPRAHEMSSLDPNDQDRLP